MIEMYHKIETNDTPEHILMVQNIPSVWIWLTTQSSINSAYVYSTTGSFNTGADGAWITYPYLRPASYHKWR